MIIDSYNRMYNVLLGQNKAKYGKENQDLLKTKSKSSSLVNGKFNVEKKQTRKITPDIKAYRTGFDLIRNNDDYYNPNLKTGYDWIDNFTFKKDSTGPMSRDEIYHLNTLKISLSDEQKGHDIRYAEGRGPKQKVDPSKYLDKDGYFANGFSSFDMPKMERREKLNTQINDMLKENGITISGKEEFDFKIDVYNKVSVVGNIDEDKKEAIAKVMNDNNMGKQLVATTNGLAYKKQRYTQLELDKYTLNKELQRYTDIDLRDFEYEGNNLISKKDGRTILDVYCEAINNSENVPDVSKGVVKSTFNNTLKRVMNFGFDKINDVTFDIGYKSNKLYDNNAVCGFGVGQTKWYDDLLKSRGNITDFNKYANERFLQLEKYEKYNQYATISG